jgi:signal transduction histidine kinase
LFDRMPDAYRLPVFDRESTAGGRARPLILLVDDDEIQRLVGREYFESIGFDVCDLASGYDCVEQVPRVRPDLVILDVIMPGIDGFEACRRIRSDPDLVHTPVLMVTSLDDEGSIERAFEAGATDFLTKPMNWPLLGHRVKFVLRMSQVERKLRDAMRSAEAANRAKSNFLANMSHELRTPLNAIIGFSEIMRGELLGPLGDHHYVEYANDIYDSGAHLLYLVNSVLDLSKVDAGMMELDEDSVAIETIVRAATMLVVDRAAKHRIKLRLSIPHDAPKIWADEIRLKQILTNLLSNAVKFTPDDGEVHVEVGRSPEGEVVFSIRDTGIGMAAEDIPKIQESFVQLDDPLQKRYAGTGLGVPLAIAMTKLHSGSLHYESQLGVGTTAILKLPARRVLEDTDVSHGIRVLLPGGGNS